MSVVLAVPPVEVDMSIQMPKGDGFEFVETALAAYMRLAECPGAA